MFRFFERFNSSTCKANLMISKNRIEMSRNRISNNMKSIRRQVAGLLQEGSEEKARIKCELLIQETNMVLALNLMEIMCDLLCTRMNQIANEKECPADLISTIQSVIYAQSRLGFQELRAVSRQFEMKYGKEFAENAKHNKTQYVHFKLVHALSVRPPMEVEILNELNGIAKEFKISLPKLAPPHPSQDGFDLDTIHKGIVLKNYKSFYPSGYDDDASVDTQNVNTEVLQTHEMIDALKTPTAPPPPISSSSSSNSYFQQNKNLSENYSTAKNDVQFSYNSQLFPSMSSFKQQDNSLSSTARTSTAVNNNDSTQEDDLYARIQRLKNF